MRCLVLAKTIWSKRSVILTVVQQPWHGYMPPYLIVRSKAKWEVGTWRRPTRCACRDSSHPMKPGVTIARVGRPKRSMQSDSNNSETGTNYCEASQRATHQPNWMEGIARAQNTAWNFVCRRQNRGGIQRVECSHHCACRGLDDGEPMVRHGLDWTAENMNSYLDGSLRRVEAFEPVGDETVRRIITGQSENTHCQKSVGILRNIKMTPQQLRATIMSCLHALIGRPSFGGITKVVCFSFMSSLWPRWPYDHPLHNHRTCGYFWLADIHTMAIHISANSS